jgi:hypothetical protein
MDLLSETVNHKSRNEGIVFMGPEPSEAYSGYSLQGLLNQLASVALARGGKSHNFCSDVCPSRVIRCDV